MPFGPAAAIIFAAVQLEPAPRMQARLDAYPSPFVVAADGGAATAFAFGYPPDVVVGDLDSIAEATLAELRVRGVPIEKHPRDKNATDGQLAIERALQAEPAELVLIGFLGGPRLDQALANVLLLTTLDVDVPAVLLDAYNECRLVRPGVDCAWQTQPNEVISLLPVGTSVDGVRTHGLRWPLAGERLMLGDTRGVSNEPIADRARVSVASGLLLVTRHFPPDPGGTPEVARV